MSNWFKQIFNGSSDDILKFGRMAIDETEADRAMQLLSNPPAADSINQLHTSLTAYYQAQDVRTVYSGYQALQLALAWSDLSKGDGIICPAFVHRHTAGLLSQKGLEIHWQDIELSTFSYDLEALKKTDLTGIKALFLPYFLGIPPNNLTEMVEWARANKLLIIEDCRHSIGGIFDQKPLGRFGDLVVLSFDAMMPVNSIQGGAVLSHLPALSDKIPALDSSMLPTDSVAEIELVEEFIQFYQDRHVPDKGLLDIKRDHIYWENKWTFGQIDTEIHEMGRYQASLILSQFERAEQMGYYRQNHTRQWAQPANERGWQVPAIEPISAPGWLRYPVFVPQQDRSELKKLAKRTEIGHWYTSDQLVDSIDLNLFPNTKRCVEALILFPTEV